MKRRLRVALLSSLWVSLAAAQTAPGTPAAAPTAAQPAAPAATPAAAPEAPSATPSAAQPASATPAATPATATQAQAAPSGTAAENPAAATAQEPAAAPEGPPPARAALPPGHGALGGQAPPADVSQPDASVPPGTIDAEILDELGRPVANVPVELQVSYESVAEGPQHKTITRTTDGAGRVRFEDLSRELRYSYSLLAKRGGGSYGIAPFRLPEDRGQRVRLHLFPTTDDPMRALVGMRGFVYIQPREDVFQVEVLFRVFAMGTTSWLPRNVVMRLPEGFQAFDGPRDGLTRFVEEPGRGARLEGTFSPGQHDVRYTFQVPSKRKLTQRFELSLPPHVAELRVITEAAPGMTLDVAGFEPAEPARGPSGDRVLITRRLVRPGSGTLETVRIDLGGLPTQGSTRWIVALIAALIAAGGVASALRRRGVAKPAQVPPEDLNRARELLLEELLAVERAFAAGELGPRSREQARRELLDALARLGAPPATAS